MDFAAAVLGVPAQFVHTPNAVVVNFGMAGSHLSESVFVKHANGGLDLGNVSPGLYMVTCSDRSDILHVTSCTK